MNPSSPWPSAPLLGATQCTLEIHPLILASLSIEAALAFLDAYALYTDAPQPGSVEAADLLASARAALGRLAPVP